MNESKKIGIRMAPWAVTISATLVIAVMSLTVRASVRTGKFEANIEHNANEIEKLEVEKANQEKVEDVHEAILRLEKKFDDYVNGR